MDVVLLDVTLLYTFHKKKYKVTVIDNLKGNSSKRNLKLLKKLNRKINFFHFDIKKFDILKKLFKNSTSFNNFCSWTNCCY